MSLLNVGLQNVTLERPAMSPEYEIQTRALDSLKSTRKLAEKNASFRTAYQKSMKEPIKIISDRFERLKWKGETVKVHGAAATDDIKSSVLRVIDDDMEPGLSIGQINSKKIEKFLDGHSRSRHYMFQVQRIYGLRHEKTWFLHL